MMKLQMIMLLSNFTQDSITGEKLSGGEFAGELDMDRSTAGEFIKRFR